MHKSRAHTLTRKQRNKKEAICKSVTKKEEEYKKTQQITMQYQHLRDKLNFLQSQSQRLLFLSAMIIHFIT